MAESEPADDVANVEELGKDLCTWVRKAQLSKAETAALGGMTPEEADHLFASMFRSLGAARIRLVQAQLQASIARPSSPGQE